MERGAAPARMPRKHSSGTPWVAVRAHYGALPLMAGRARTRGGESCPAREGEESSVQWPEARPRGAKSPQIAQAGASLCACGAPQGVCVSPDARRASKARNCWCASRRSTSLGHFPGVDSPGPWSEGKEKGRRRARAANNRADGACLARTGQARRALRWLAP
jgi:hypothetical protein